MKNKLNSWVGRGAVAAGVATISANSFAAGTVDSTIQTAIDDASATFTAIKALAVVILASAIGYRLVKRFAK